MSIDLAGAKKALVANPTLEANKTFGKALALAVSQGEWLAVPIIPDERGTSIRFSYTGDVPSSPFFLTRSIIILSRAQTS